METENQNKLEDITTQFHLMGEDCICPDLTRLWAQMEDMDWSVSKITKYAESYTQNKKEKDVIFMNAFSKFMNDAIFIFINSLVL